MNTHLFAVDTSMETLETYETISTTQVIQRQNSDCPSMFRRRCLPSLLDDSYHFEDASSQDSSTLGGGEDDTAFMPWDEYQHQSVVHSMASAQVKCHSRTCPACRSNATTRFVAATSRQPSSSPRLVPKWWESATLTTALANQLGEWVETQLTCASTEERRFWREMECDEHDDTSTAPYDEKEDDPRYASF